MQDFFAMGGYAFYVWGSFGLAALCMLLEPLLLRRRHGQWLRRLSRTRERANMRRQRRAAVAKDEREVNES